MSLEPGSAESLLLLRRLALALGPEGLQEVVTRLYARLATRASATSHLPFGRHREMLEPRVAAAIEEFLTSPRDAQYLQRRRTLAAAHLRAGVPPAVYARGVLDVCDAIADTLRARCYDLSDTEEAALARAALDDLPAVLEPGD